EPIRLHRSHDVVRGVELPQPLFDTDFPGDGRTDVDGVLAVSDGLLRRFRELLRVFEPPEKYVSVEEDGHFAPIPNASAMSSGSESKSSAILTRPFHWPPTRGEMSV